MPKPPVNSKVRVVPLEIVEPNELYCHVIIGDGKDFEDMSKELAMAVKYNSLKAFEPYAAPKPMQLVFAQYSVDECWYRAIVMKIYDDDNIKVFFADFGNMETVCIDKIRKWKSQFEKVPLQAILCRLHNVQVVEEKRSLAVEYLKSSIVEQEMEATVIENQDELVIELFLNSGKQFITEYLESGFVTSM